MSIDKFKKLWMLLGLALLVVFFSGWILYQSYLQHGLDTAHDESKKKLNLISFFVKERLQKRNYQLARSLIKNWGENLPEVIEIKLTASNGFELANYSNPQISEHEIVQSINIPYSYDSVAKLRLRISIDDIYKKEHLFLYQLLAWYLLIAIILWFLVFINVRAQKQKQVLLKENIRRQNAEKALKESVQNLDITLNSIGDAVIVTDEAGMVTRMNPVAEKLTGWPLDEAKDKSLKDIFPIVDASTREPIENPVEKVIATGETIYLSNHTTLVARDGSEYQIADSAAPIRDGNGKDDIQGMILVFNDVTEQYQLREIATKNRKDLQAIMNYSPAVVYVKDINGRYLFINQQYEKLFHVKNEDIIGKTDYDIFPEHIADEVARNDQMVLDSASVLELEEEVPSDGALHTYVSIKFPLYNEADEVYAVGGISTDITQRKKLENEEFERRQRVGHYNDILTELIQHQGIVSGNFHDVLGSITELLSNAVNVSRVSIWTLDKTENAIKCLDSWDKRTQEHSIGDTLSAADYPSYFESLMTGRTLSIADVYNNPGTTELMAEYFPTYGITSMLDAPFHSGGEIAGVLCVEHTGHFRKWKIEEEAFIISVADILSIAFESSRRKELEGIVRQTQKMDALGKLTGGIAHDYNNMLGVILGYATMLETGLSEQPKLMRYVREIHHAAERGTKLTGKLLAFSRQKNMVAEKVDINVLLQNQQHMLEKTMTSRIKIGFDMTDDLWSVCVDRGELEDAIINLCINAMHAIDGNGQLTIQTNNEQINEHDALALNLDTSDYVALSITDTGCGMDESTRERIFEPFYSTKGDKGTGLGLSQVYGFVERSGGVIKVLSEPGQGTRIEMCFPRCDVCGTDNQVVDIPDTTDLKGKETILVVDDEPALLGMVEEMLSLQGYHVICAESGEQALDVLADKSVDLMLSDVIMHGIDGYELASIVQEKYPDIKIQLASGYTDGRNVDFVDDHLRQNLIYKPYSSDALLKRLRELLSEDSEKLY